MADTATGRHQLLVGYRILFALVCFAAIITEIATLVERGTFAPANFFSYFTVEANAFATAVFLLSALSRGHDRLRGASTLYMAICGIGFSVLLSGIEDAELTAVPWDNVVLHYLMPVVVALDWFLDLPRTRIAYRSALPWLAFPLAYAAYSLIRGPIVDWYPYPFLNPEEHGYAGIAVAVVGLVVLASLLIWVLARSSGSGPAIGESTSRTHSRRDRPSRSS